MVSTSSNPIIDCRRAVDTAPCIQQPTVEAHTRSIDAAHNKLRDHDSSIAGLATQTAHYLERLVRVEAATGENHRLMLKLQGGVEALRVEQTGIRQSIERIVETETSTHELLTRHMDRSAAQAEETHLKRLAQVEHVSMRLVKIATALAVVGGFGAMIYSVLAGKPLLSLLVGGTP
jgi:hypothetical protein